MVERCFFFGFGMWVVCLKKFLNATIFSIFSINVIFRIEIFLRNPMKLVIVINYTFRKGKFVIFFHQIFDI